MLKNIGSSALIVIAIFAIILFQPWIVMILLGSVHSFLPWVPALGFWQVVLVELLIYFIFSPLKAAK